MSTKILAAAALLLTGYAVGRVAPAPVAAAQAQPGHVYEMRTYTAADGKLPNLNARFRDHTMRIFAKHNMKSIGYWTPIEGPTAGTTLVYILEHPSREEATKNWAAFNADPEWQKAKADSEVGGKLVAKAEPVFLTPTDYSPIK
ncbi:MAG TPA: NIPSNAP family protein [Vicinamibacterales bacterium]|nr:NIPSNAP family protein [Vicinamibacterales bacterium]